MNELWQLKKISTGESLNDPQLLPENWGPIFGLAGFVEKLADLSWIGNEYADMGWFVVGEAVSTPVEPTSPPLSLLQWQEAKRLLRDSDWSVLSDVPMNSGKRADWIEYRQKLREIRLQPGFPEEIHWPLCPD
jgi:hypothetical protein